MRKARAWARGRSIVAAACAVAALQAYANPQEVERARGLLAGGNAKQAYEVLSRLQGEMSGQPEFDYLLGVAALDSGRNDEAIISFERVLALIPNHAGAQMDLARAYYATGSFDLAEAAFLKLRASNPPPAAQQAIARYLDAIQQRKRQAQAGWVAYGELGMGYDTNITGVPTDFGAAAAQSFNLSGIEATGNSIKRRAAFITGAAGAEYARPFGGGWGWFAGGDVRGRGYQHESDFNNMNVEARTGIVRNAEANQIRGAVSYFEFRQEGDAPGDPKPTNDRKMGGASFEWRHALDTRTQIGLALQANRVKFPTTPIEDFDQVFLTLSYLKSFDRKGAPLIYLTAFGSDDKAKNTSDDGTTKSKNLFGLRSYMQYGLGQKLQAFGSLGWVHRKDKDDYARAPEVQKGRDNFYEFSIGTLWQFRDRCNLRLAYAFSTNKSNIDIYDFNRHEISSIIRCEMA